ncbi:hypothetical protein ACTJJB_32540 [Chitinophaga sp. 22536]|uniref:hypothetical protein n=1 Tax=unclassified Chitinophaga TaxID=2619133 RepID=UPI003F870668
MAELDNEELYIGVKGATSVRGGSARFEKGFSSDQAKKHIAVTVIPCLKQMNLLYNSSRWVRYAIALPDNQDHVKKIEQVAHLLKSLGIAVYFVSESLVRQQHIFFEPNFYEKTN